MKDYLKELEEEFEYIKDGIWLDCNRNPLLPSKLKAFLKKAIDEAREEGYSDGADDTEHNFNRNE